MPFDPTLAAIRFGVGLSPTVAPPSSVEEMLTRLAGPDEIAAAIPIAPYSEVYPSLADFRSASRALNDARGTDGEEAAAAHQSKLREDGRLAVAATVQATVARAAYTEDGFRERLVAFWADHFTARAVNGISRHHVSAYIEEAIRPHINGSFADMLIAVVSSPMMILYLDQHQSMGPNSVAALRRDRGLNENMAREVLELHTLGVGGTYTQTDVREFAELLTGVTASVQRGAYFRDVQAEPGSETVLGVTYGGDVESMEHVEAALRDLSVHPDTARHLARKLVVHFVGGTPDPDMIEDMAAAYLEDDGGMMALYRVLLSGEVAWHTETLKVKQPIDFIASAVRALGVPRGVILGASIQQVRQLVLRHLSVMGQSWQSPVGPDGWSEAAEDWITPQGMAGRITWAMQVPVALLDELPDPRDFVFSALGPTPPDAVIFAANAAETVSDGVGIILASAAFQRR